MQNRAKHFQDASRALENSGLFTRVGLERRMEVAIYAAKQLMSSDSEATEEMSEDYTSSRSFGYL